jgi:hypothetical protein
VVALVDRHLEELRAAFATYPDIDSLFDLIGQLDLTAAWIFMGESLMAPPRSEDAPGPLDSQRIELERLRMVVLANGETLDFVRAHRATHPGEVAIYEGMALQAGAGMSETDFAEYTRLMTEAARLAAIHTDKAQAAASTYAFRPDRTDELVWIEPDLGAHVVDGRLTVTVANMAAVMSLLHDTRDREMVMAAINYRIQFLAIDVAAYAHIRAQCSAVLNRAHGVTLSWAQWMTRFSGMAPGAFEGLVDSAFTSFGRAGAVEAAVWKDMLGKPDLTRADLEYGQLAYTRRRRFQDRPDRITIEALHSGILAFLAFMGVGARIEPFTGYAPDLFLLTVTDGDVVTRVILDLMEREGKLDNPAFDRLGFFGERLGVLTAYFSASGLSEEDIECVLHELGHMLQLAAYAGTRLGLGLHYSMFTEEVGSMVCDAMVGDNVVRGMFGLAPRNRDASFVGQALLWERQANWGRLFLEVFSGSEPRSGQDLEALAWSLLAQGSLVPGIHEPMGIWNVPHFTDAEIGPLYGSYPALRPFSAAIAQWGMHAAGGPSALLALYRLGAVFADFPDHVRGLFPGLNEEFFGRMLTQVYAGE